MCCCAKPNINGEPGYSWDGKSISTRQVAPPTLSADDVLVYDEPGRCGGMDSHCHHYRLVKTHGTTYLLVRHGGGEERLRMSFPRGFSLDAIDSNTRYWLLNAIHNTYSDGNRQGVESTSNKYRTAFAEGRLKKRKMKAGVKVWIEPTLAATA